MVQSGPAPRGRCAPGAPGRVRAIEPTVQSPAPSARRARSAAQLAAPALLAVLFVALASPRLAEPPEPAFDEVYHASSAAALALGRGLFEQSHPPLAKLLMAAGLALDPEGARQGGAPLLAAARRPGLLFAALAVLAMYALARALTGRALAGFLAAALLATDTMLVVFARTAMTNVYLVFFVLLAALSLWQASAGGRWRWYALAGLSLGCAVATRWTGIALGGALAAIALARAAAVARAGPAPFAWPAIARALLPRALLVAALALLVYVLSYAPLLLATSDQPWQRVLTTFSGPGRGWHSVLEAQRLMIAAHAKPGWETWQDSAWWSWPLLLAPPAFTKVRDAEGAVRAVLAVGNPLLWWAAVPALLAGLVAGLRRRRWEQLYLAVPALLVWLVFAARPGVLGYTHYFFESAVLAAPLVAGQLVRLCDSETETPRRRSVARAVVALYLAGCVGWLAGWLPVVTWRAVTPNAWAARLLFPGQWDPDERRARFREEHGLQDEQRFLEYMKPFTGRKYRRALEPEPPPAEAAPAPPAP